MLNAKKLGELALGGVDRLGYQLDSMGVTDQLNRHNLAAWVFTGQKQFEGELASIKARMNMARARINRVRKGVDSTIQTTTSLALTPVRFAGKMVNQAKDRLF